MSGLRSTVADTDPTSPHVGSVSEPQPTDVPAGTISDILTWVDADPARAQAALDVELAATKPRVTLVEQLRQIVQAG